MKIDDFTSNWLKPADLEGQPVVTIAKVERQTFTDGGQGIVLTFKEMNKPMTVNRTNGKQLVKAFGDESDNWIGKQVELFTVKTQKPDGTPTDGIRIDTDVKASDVF